MNYNNNNNNKDNDDEINSKIGSVLIKYLTLDSKIINN